MADAFDGAQVAVQISDDGRFEVTMQQPGMLRPLRTAELSDGTLRFLMWAVASLTPSPPPLKTRRRLTCASASSWKNRSAKP